MRTLVLAITLALLAGFAPSAAAASQKSYAFTPTVNAAAPIGGTLALANAATAGSGAVNLPANGAVTWVYPTPLATGVAFTNGAFAFDLYFANHVGSVKVVFGDYEQDPVTHVWHFRALKASQPTTVAAASRNLVGGQTLPRTGTSLDIGRATATISGVNGAFPRGSYPAIQVISSNSNGLFTSAGTLGATSASSATVPLPELPALALLGLGALVVGGVVVVRSKKGWT